MSHLLVKPANAHLLGFFSIFWAIYNTEKGFLSKRTKSLKIAGRKLKVLNTKLNDVEILLNTRYANNGKNRLDF